MNQFTVKPTIVYPKNIQKEVDRLGVQKQNMKVFGSFIYRFQKYPGDVDILENVTLESKEKMIKFFVKKIKAIVKDILHASRHYFADFKAGVDDMYGFPIGYLSNGIYTVDPEFKSNLEVLSNAGMIEPNDYNLIRSILSRVPLFENSFDTIMKIMRKYYVIRWQPNEITAGHKKLRSGRMITLEEACSQKAVVKIDEIVFLNDRFVEITNIYGLHYKTGDETVDSTLISNIEGVTVDIEKLYYSNLNYSIFKAIKRIFSYCNYQYKAHYMQSYTNYIDISKKLLPILEGNVSLLYQLKSELDTIVVLYELFGNVSPVSIARQLDNMKNRLSTVTELKNEDIIYFSEAIDQINNVHDLQHKLRALEGLSTYLKIYIDYFTINYLNSVEMNPFPPLVLPSETILHVETPDDKLFTKKVIKKYNHNEVREPLDMPFVDYNLWLNSFLPGGDKTINADSTKEAILENLHSL